MAAALSATGAVHLLLASTYARGSAIVGAAFVLGGAVALAAAAWLVISDADAAWDLAALVSGGMLVALAASATVGLFGIMTSRLGTAEGVSLVAEISVLVAWAATRLRRRLPTTRPSRPR